MKPSLRRILAVTAPVAVLAAASTASAGLLATPSYLTDNKVYPTVLDTDGSSYVDVAVRWAPHLLRRGKAAHEMRVTLTGKGRKGAPVKFDSKTVKRGATRYEVVRLRIKKKQRGAYANARNVVVSSVHHWTAPSKGANGAASVTKSNLVAVSDANVKGTIGKGQFTMRSAKDCDVATLGPNSNAAGCDFSGANLAGANLSNANLSGTILDNANLAGANLSSANVTGASMVGTNIAGANFGATSQAAFTLPQAGNPGQGSNPVCQQTGGGPMCEAIYSAKSTIGAVYYQFAGPNVTRWMQDAIKRGVNVFIIENSANTTPGSDPSNPLCQTVSATDPACAWSPKADPFYALEAQLKSVVGPGTGQVRVQFSSQNFNITHQKTVLVDVLDSGGNALNPAQISAAGGSAIVSTGNLMAYPNYWGQRTATINGTPAVINQDYLTNPAAGCAFAPDKACDDEWTPRDFAMKVTDADILARVAGVYASDLSCAPATATNVQRIVDGQFYPGLVPDPAGSDPVSAQWPETWSNGSVYTGTDPKYYPMPPGQQAGAYPAPGLYPFGYFAYGDDKAKPPTTTYQPDLDMGNVRARQLALINSAKKTLVVYNEEMADFSKPYVAYPGKYDPQKQAVDVTKKYVVNALIGAAQRGVKVTIVMANAFWTPTGSSTSVPDSNAPTWKDSFNALLAPVNYAGKPNAVVPQIQLLDEDGALYIHAKAIVADGVDGWFGSINASTPSMNDNRELGLGVTTRPTGSSPAIPATYSPQMVAAVTTAAASDAAQGTSWTSARPKTSSGSGSSGYMSAAQFPCINTQQNPASGLPPRDPANPATPPQASTTAAQLAPKP